MSSEKIAQHLLNVASLVTNAGSSGEKVAYHMRDICARLEDRGFLKLSKKQFGPHEQCTYCHKSWCDGDFKLRIIPMKHKASFLRLLRKDESKLNKYQKKLKERIPLTNFNITTIKCLQCQKITKFKTTKSSDSKIDTISENTSEFTETTESTVTDKEFKKKKKKKDYCAGLNPQIVVRKLKKSQIKSERLKLANTGVSELTKEENVKLINKNVELSFPDLLKQDELKVKIDSNLGISVLRSNRDESLRKDTSEVSSSRTAIPLLTSGIKNEKLLTTVNGGSSSSEKNRNKNNIISLSTSSADSLDKKAPQSESKGKKESSISKNTNLISPQTIKTVKKKKSKKKHKNKSVEKYVPDTGKIKKSSLILDQILNF